MLGYIIFIYLLLKSEINHLGSGPIAYFRGNFKIFSKLMLLFYTGWRQIQSIVVGKPEEIITVQEIIKGKKFKIIIFEEKYI